MIIAVPFDSALWYMGSEMGELVGLPGTSREILAYAGNGRTSLLPISRSLTQGACSTNARPSVAARAWRPYLFSDFRGNYP